MKVLFLHTKMELLNKCNVIKQELKNASTSGISMRLRLFLFLVVLVLTMILGVFVILLLTGTFAAGLNESKKLVESELSHITRDVSDQMGGLSAQAVDFSRGLSESIEKNLAKQGLKVSDLQNHPEILEDLVGKEYERLIFTLQKTKSSGIFVILNTTVNAKLKDAENSKTGLYIKNMEPNIISASTPTFHVLRGFPNIARKNALPLHSQWAMEFDVKDAPYYRMPMEQAARQKLPLSRLYYWSPALTLPGTSEEVILCSIPLLDSKGNVFGVCGFEVSAMLFKLAYMPDNTTYDRIFCILAPVTDKVTDNSSYQVLNISQALYSGRYRALNSGLPDHFLYIIENQESFHTYQQEGSSAFAGLHEPIQLYPKGSPFAGQKWVLALIMPQKDLNASISSLNLRLALLSLLLMVAGIVASYFISRHYLRPIAKGMDIIKSNNFIDAPKTKIPEIDDLIEFLSLHDKRTLQKPVPELPDSVYDEFVKNTKTLSPAERAVFDLYVQGHTAKEITQILCLSINTIKTHNKRIYLKLNVASREDLLLYVNMLKKMGKELE